MARASCSSFSSSATFCGRCRAWRSGRCGGRASGCRRRVLRRHLDPPARPARGDACARCAPRPAARLRRCRRNRRTRSSRRDRAHADALVDVEAAGLDDAFLQAPALAARVLEIEVGVVDAGASLIVRQRLRERALRRGRRARAAGCARWPGVRWWVRGRSSNDSRVGPRRFRIYRRPRGRQGTWPALCPRDRGRASAVPTRAHRATEPSAA